MIFHNSRNKNNFNNFVTASESFQTCGAAAEAWNFFFSTSFRFSIRSVTELRTMTTAEKRTQQINTLHRKYAGIIYDLCVHILKDPAEAEDAVQETFLNAFRALDSFSYGDNYLPWLYRIGTNACLKMLRTKKRKGALPMEDIETAAGSSAFSDPADRLAVRARLETLQHTLDERNMEILVSHFVLGMNQQEVANMLGISRRAVVKRLTRLKQTFSTLPDMWYESASSTGAEDRESGNE